CLERRNSVQRPVDEERLADDVSARQRTPDAAVVAVPAVVAEHEVVALRDLVRPEPGGGPSGRAVRRDVALVQGVPGDVWRLDQYRAVPHLDRFPGQANDPLDVVDARLGLRPLDRRVPTPGRMEDDD